MEHIDYKDIKKGSHVVCKDCPCKVIEVNTSAPGKHGHAKKACVCIDVITDRKYEEIYTHHSHVQVPEIKREEYQVSYVDIDGYMSMMDSNGNTREDICLPEDHDADADLHDQIKDICDDGDVALCQILTAKVGNKEQYRIVGVKKL